MRGDPRPSRRPSWPPTERGRGARPRGSPARSPTPSRAYRTLFETRATGPFDVDLWSARAWADHPAGRAGARRGDRRHRRGRRASRSRQVALDQRPHRDPGRREPDRPDRVLDGHRAAAGPAAGRRADLGLVRRDEPTAGSPGPSRTPTGRVVQTVTEFGMLAKIGVNDRGVGVMLNMLHHANDADAVAGGEIGHPVHLLSPGDPRRRRPPSTRPSRSPLPPPTSASTSLTVVDDRGGAVTIELFPGGPGLRFARGRRAGAHQPLRLRRPAGTAAWRAPSASSTELRRDHLLEPRSRSRMPQTAAGRVRRDDPPPRRRRRLPAPAHRHRPGALAPHAGDGRHRRDRPHASTSHENGPCGHRMLPVEQTGLSRQAGLGEPTASSSSGDIGWSHDQAAMFLA